MLKLTNAMPRCLSLFIPCFALLFGNEVHAGEVSIKETSPTSWEITIDGKPFTTLITSGDFRKPFFLPVRTPSGISISRRLNDPDDRDHPHHKGLWVSVDEVNGQKFWNEDAPIRNQSVKIIRNHSDTAVLQTVNHWIHSDGETPLVRETTAWTISDRFLIAAEIKLTAIADQVTFDDTKEGLFGFRMAPSMKEKNGGLVTASDGTTTTANCWGQPFRWIDYAGRVENQPVGITLMDHPTNFRPSRYHVRNYGLFAANPFGENAYTKGKQAAAPVHLKHGDSMTLRYAAWIHDGSTSEADVPGAWQHFLDVAPVTATPAAAAADKPNLVIILCDDLGYGDLGIHGHPHIRTPHLDQLARNGLHCTTFYSCAPVCSPSRVGLMTGRSPNRAGVYDWIPPGSRPRPDAREQVHMRTNEVTLPALLQDAGYATCMAGKWHCNSQFNSPHQPQPGDAGFDHWLATQNNAAPSHANPKNYVRNGEPVGPLEGYSCRIAVQEATDWLTSHREANPDQPFFVYLPFHEPHEPVASPPELVAHYEGVAVHPDQAQYFANVENVDTAVGEFLKTLDQLNCRENTLVVFTSDNGPETLNRYRSANRSWGITGPYRGMKLHTHDGGFHVAGIINWPAVIDEGRSCNTPVSALDLLPTFCDLAGAALPEHRRFDGTSLKDLLLNESPPQRSDPLVWCYFNAINDARVAMRHGPWKVLARLDRGEFPKLQNLTPATHAQAAAASLSDFEIYHAANDPGETQNLSHGDLPEKEELIALLRQEWTALMKDSPAWTPAAR